MRRRIVAALIGLATMAGVLNVVSSAQAAATQFTFFDAVMQQTATSYFEPPFNAPTDWTSPTNFSGGTAYWKVTISGKPSTLPVNAQVCMWRSKWTVETCSGYISNITKDGTYWANLGTPQNWWKKNGNWSWTTTIENTRIMIKDAQSGKLLISTKCGDACYPRSDLSQHVPFTIDSELVIVAKGAALEPLSNWSGCPSTWSTQCSSGGSTSSSSSSTSSTTSSTTATTQPPSALEVSVSDARVTEPDTGYVSLPFKVSLNKKSSSPVTVDVNIAPGTATEGVDYGNRGGYVQVKIPAGTLEAWVGFPIWGDTVAEPDETVDVSLSNVIGAAVGDGTGTGTIVNDDGSGGTTTTSTTAPPPSDVSVSIADARVTEPDSGYVSLPFQLTLSKASSSPVTVTVNIAPGTATAGVDYGTNGGAVKVTIPAGSTWAWVGFPVYGDTTPETNETVKVSLSSPVGASIGDGYGVGTIVNDD